MNGWIKIHRQIQDNSLWTCESFTRGQAWVDLLLLANHKPSYFYKRGVKINVDRGQVGRSEVELADRWHWSRTKVRRFLNDLEKEQQIIQHKTNVTQLITVIKYDYYQQNEQQVIQQKDNRKSAEKHIQECKEGKEVLFTQFWNIYNKKVDKQKTIQKWNTLTIADQQAILTSLPKYIESTPDKQFRRNPLRFLNNRSWENEVVHNCKSTNEPIIDSKTKADLTLIEA